MKAHLFVSLVLAPCLAASFVSAQQIQVSKENRTIAVTTNDIAKAEADSATVHIGFITYAQDTKAAYASGSETSSAIVKALSAAGVKPDAIQSEAQTVAETQPFQFQALSPLEQLQHRYKVEQSWTVRCGAKDAAGVLNAAVNAGANNSGQIDWQVRDENALEAQASGNALKRARAIAQQMATGLNAQLGNLIYASNEAPAPPITPRAMAMEAPMMKGAGSQETPPLSISPRQVTKSATVYAVFALQ